MINTTTDQVTCRVSGYSPSVWLGVVVSCIPFFSNAHWSCLGQETINEFGADAGGEFIAQPIQRIDPVEMGIDAGAAAEVPVIDSPLALAESWDEKLESLLSWGPMDIRPHIDYDVAYNDNIFASAEEDEIDDVIHEFSPGFAIESVDSRMGGIGAEPLYLTLDYTPTFRMFQETTSQNNVDQTASLVVQQPFQRLGLIGDFNFLDTQNPFIEAGNRSQKTIYQGGVRALYELGGKSRLDLGLRTDVRDFDILINTKQWRNINWLDYEHSEKLDLGIGVGVGYTEVEGNSNFITEELQGRTTWNPTAKLVASLSAGAQWRQFREDNDDDGQVSPIVSGDLTWFARQNTLLRLLVSQQVSASNFVRANTEENTEFRGQLRQRLLQKFDFTLSGGVGYIESDSFDPTVVTVGSRSYHFYRAQVAYRFLERGIASIYFQRRDREGNLSVNESTVNRVGLRLGYSF